MYIWYLFFIGIFMFTRKSIDSINLGRCEKGKQLRGDTCCF